MVNSGKCGCICNSWLGVCVCVCLCVCMVQSKQEDGVLTPKHVGVILIYIYTTYLWICWYIINIYYSVCPV